MDRTFEDSELGEVEWLHDDLGRAKGSALVTWGALVLFCLAPALAFLLVRLVG